MTPAYTTSRFIDITISSCDQMSDVSAHPSNPVIRQKYSDVTFEPNADTQIAISGVANTFMFIYPPRTKSAAFSPIIRVAAFVFAAGIVGIMDASATRSASIPWTFNR